MARATWGSRVGFILAVAGSAVGLANIWRFPYIVGANGGAAFLIIYLLCLLLIGFPVFISEILIGRTSQVNPHGAFLKVGRKKPWGWAGMMTIVTGFIVSAFYSAVAGRILGYFIESLRGEITDFQTTSQAVEHYEQLMANPYWGLSYHFIFLTICSIVLYMGVRKGIERGTKIMMPLLFVVLFLLVLKGINLDGAKAGIQYLFSPDWDEITPNTFLVALGQAFFTLSLGQGTMVTYGSYLNKHENLIKSCVPVIIVDTLVSILSAIAVFTIVFSASLEPDSGSGLIFHTLPITFSLLPGGTFLAIMFFLLVVVAAITSQISAMEPTISYLIDEKGWSRHSSVWICAIGVLLLGIPCALSSNVLSELLIFDMTFLDFFEWLVSSIMIPLGGFLAVILVGWFWGFKNAITHLKQGARETFEHHRWLKPYFKFCLKYSAPILILLVFLNALGLFSKGS